MAVGVNSNPNTPNGPERDNNMYTTRPTTTGGNPINAFKTAITALRCLKRFTASQAPSGRPKIEAMTTADSVTRKDRTTISSRSASSDNKSLPASVKPCTISLILVHRYRNSV